MQAKKSKKPIIIVAVLLVVAIVAAVAIYMATRPATTAGSKTITVVVDTGTGEAKTHTLQTDAEYLADVLLAEGLVEGSESEFGLFITTVDGVTADDTKEQWWCITKGGETVMTGASETPIADGDTFELTLTEGYGEF